MKVSNSNILSLVLVLNGAMASPLRARGYEVVTVTEFETAIVHVTSTAWVDPAQYGPTEVPTTTPAPHEKNKNHVPTSTPSVSISETLASPTVSPSISELSVVPSSTLAYSSVETTQQTTLSIPSTTISTPSTSIPTTTSVPAIKSMPTTTSELPTLPSTSISEPTSTQAPTTLEKSTLPVPTTISTPPPVKTEPSTTAPAPLPSSPAVKAPASGSFTGDATYYNTGLGSCGIVSQDTDCIAAISAILYDSKGTGNPNNNPYCNTVILVSYKGGPEIPVTIVDRCPECAQHAIDLSPAAFTKMGANQNDGRVPVSWRFAS